MRQAPAQFASVAAQLALQAPFEQTSPAVHALPHAPQWAGSLFRSVHAPSQADMGALHVSSHLPATQLAVPAPSGQWLPQLPQLSGSVARSAHTLPHAA